MEVNQSIKIYLPNKTSIKKNINGEIVYKYGDQVLSKIVQYYKFLSNEGRESFSGGLGFDNVNVGDYMLVTTREANRLSDKHKRGGIRWFIKINDKTKFNKLKRYLDKEYEQDLEDNNVENDYTELELLRNNESLKKYPINSLFPKINCDDLKWSDIGLDYCSQDKIEIEISKVKKKIKIEQFKLNKTNNNWNLLFAISTLAGFIDYPTLYRILGTKKNNTIQKNISRLNKHLIRYFGIDENPIYYDYGDKSYRTKFLYIRSSYAKKAKEIQNSNEVYIDPQFDELDDNLDYNL